MKRISTMLAGVAIGTALVFALSTGVAGAAKSGNSANAKKCQGTGYLDWVDANGNAFASAEACTAYAAKKGNVLQPKPVRTWQSVCEDELGGEYFEQGGIAIQCSWASATQAFVASADVTLLPFCPGEQINSSFPGGPPSPGFVQCVSSRPPRGSGRFDRPLKLTCRYL